MLRTNEKTADNVDRGARENGNRHEIWGLIKEKEPDLDPFFVQSQEHIPNAKNRRLDSGFEYTGRHA